jgi:hypothetical protein
MDVLHLAPMVQHQLLMDALKLLQNALMVLMQLPTVVLNCAPIRAFLMPQKDAVQ